MSGSCLVGPPAPCVPSTLRSLAANSLAGDSKSAATRDHEIGRPARLYDLGWEGDCSYRFARLRPVAPDPVRASGFRLYSILVQAAVNRLGVSYRTPAVGREGAGTQYPGARLPPRGSRRGARMQLPGHDRGRKAPIRGTGVPGMDSAGGRDGGPSEWRPRRALFLTRRGTGGPCCFVVEARSGGWRRGAGIVAIDHGEVHPAELRG